MKMQTLVLDIETENLGANVMTDNTRVISIQLGDENNQTLYFADSKKPENSLDESIKRINLLISEGYVFAGYSIKRFDVPILKELLNIEIPEENILELTHTTRFNNLLRRLGKRYLSLADACAALGINASHKKKMITKAEGYLTRPDILNKAKKEAPVIAKKKGGSVEYAYNESIRKIAGGYAIYDAYIEFVQKDGARDTLFYEYAVGDIVCEYKLFKKLTE